MTAETTKRLYNEVPLPVATPDIGGAPYRAGDWKKLPQIIHDEAHVHGFFGEHRGLSNFGQATVWLDGVSYNSVEKAYQAAKWNPEDRWPFNDCKNEDAIRYNRTHQPNRYTSEQWDEVKLDIMRFLLEQKFDPIQNPVTAAQLLATNDRHLAETNWWGDTYWGVDLDGSGENNLGKLLMEIRAILNYK